MILGLYQFTFPPIHLSQFSKIISWIADSVKLSVMLLATEWWLQDEALVVTSCEGCSVTSPQEVNGIHALKIGFSLALPPVRFTLCAEIGQKPVLLHPVVNKDFPGPCCWEEALYPSCPRLRPWRELEELEECCSCAFCVSPRWKRKT